MDMWRDKVRRNKEWMDSKDGESRRNICESRRKVVPTPNEKSDMWVKQ